MRFRLTLASGRQALGLATELLHRVRLADPYAGVWEAADLHWWWRTPRRSDDVGQLFWLDADEPIAAALLTDWTRAWGFDPIVVPHAHSDIGPLVWSAALSRIDDLSLGDIETIVRDDDEELGQFLRSSGFHATDDRGAATWMDAADRPPVPDIPHGFEVVDRKQSSDRPHPLAARNGPGVEGRLNELELYDPELDLAIRAPTGETAAYALFWFDPVTHVGLVEPMRTEEAWRRRGLARMLLATGLDRLARRGSQRLKVGFSTSAARDLYVGAGFRVDAAMTTYVRQSLARH